MKKKNIAFVARDHFGIKPLYFFKNKNFIFLGSEIRPLKNLINISFDEKTLGELIFFRYLSGTKTGYKNVYKVDKGQCLEIDLRTHKIKTSKYFDILDTINPVNQITNINEQVLGLLENSIIKHTQSDVGFSVQLSGGLDSSLIVAILKKNNKKFNSYSLVFEENNFDERNYQDLVSKLYPNNNIKVNCDSQTFADNFEKTIESLEAPTPHFGCVLLYKLCETISQHNKVVLTGEGADELFAGYSRYLEINKFLAYKKIVQFLPDLFLNNFRRLNFLKYYKYNDPFMESMTFRKFDIFKEVFHDITLDLKFRTEIYENFSNPFDKLCAFDQAIYLESLLHRQDKISMAHGLEVRVPFVDLPLIKFINSLDRKTKYDKQITKKILKSVSSLFFPKNFINRKKNGLLIPISKWLDNKKGFGRFLDLLMTANCNLYKYCEKKKIKDLVDKFKKDKEIGPAIAHLINIEAWLLSVNKNN